MIYGNWRASACPGEIDLIMSGKKCTDLMTKNVTCCVAKDTAYAAAKSMQTDDVGAIPIVDSHDKKKLVGIVTDRDLALKVVGQGLDSRTTPLTDVMSRKMVVCKTGDDWQTALDAMAKHQLRRIPVIDEQGSVVGIIAQADVATRTEQPAATAKVVEAISK